VQPTSITFISKGSKHMNDAHQWTTAHDAWSEFVKQHPELGYRPGQWQLHNFLRHFRAELCRHDAIRKAKGRHWVAHRARFVDVAFDCATGRVQTTADSIEV
jgi:hypothetical protein